MGHLDWHADAECRHYPPEWWHMEGRIAQARAIDICGTCPVITQCRAYADSIPNTYGVWAGRIYRIKTK